MAVDGWSIVDTVVVIVVVVDVVFVVVVLLMSPPPPPSVLPLPPLLLLLLAEGVEFDDEFSDCKRIVYFVNVATAHAILTLHTHRTVPQSTTRGKTLILPSDFGMRILCTRYYENIPHYI